MNGGVPSTTLASNDPVSLGALLVAPAQSAAAIAGGYVVLYCVPPPGQGSQVPVVMAWYSSPTDTLPAYTASNFAIAYAAPSIATVDVLPPTGGISSATGTYSILSPLLRLPTQSTTLRVHGANLGNATTSSPLLVISGGLSPVSLLGVPCPGTAAAQTCYLFSGTPPLTGQQAIGYSARVWVGGQPSIASWSVAYALPYVVSVGAPGAAFPAVGGVQVAIRGADFGAPQAVMTPGAVIASYTPPGANSPSWSVNMTGCAVVNTTLITCILPPGSGANLPLVVTIAGQSSMPSTGTGTLTYNAPTVTNVTVANTATLAAVAARTPGLNASLPTTISAALSNTTSQAALHLNAAAVAPPTTGGAILLINGVNFGPTPTLTPASPTPVSAARTGAGAGNCVFLTWHYRASVHVGGASPSASSTPSMTPTSTSTSNGGVSSGVTAAASSTVLVPFCDGIENWVGEGELASSTILFWSDTLIVVQVSAGAGVKDVVVGARGGLSQLAAGIAGTGQLVAGTTAPPTFRYAAPRLLGWSLPALSAGGDTAGGVVLTLTGENFGPAASTSWSTGANTLSAAPSLPSSMTIVRFNGGCFTNTVDQDGGRSSGLAVVGAGCYNLAGPLGLLTQNDTTITFLLPPGVGAGLNLSVEIWDDPAATSPEMSSAPLTFNYTAPVITGFAPAPITLAGVNASLTVIGAGFGDPSAAGTWPLTWTLSQSVLDLQLANATGGGRVPCYNLQRNLASIAGPELTCIVPFDAPVGALKATVNVAGQFGYTSTAAPGSNTGLYIACGPGFFGRVGEKCLACPQAAGSAAGATCAGYVPLPTGGLASTSVVTKSPTYIASSADSSATAALASQWAKIVGAVNASDTATLALLEASLYGRPLQTVVPGDAVNTYPVALPGFYSLSTTCVTTFKDSDGSVDDPCPGGGTDTSSACPPGLSALFPDRDTCVVACDPPESCLGANVCAPGYRSLAPYYACRACAPTYYRTGGTCTACPASGLAYARLIGFVILVLVAGALFFFLNKAGVAIGSVAIGLDYLQVIAILAQTNVAWPTGVADLLRGMSAFNLNIEVVAPECVDPDVTFQQKFAAVLLLPITVAVFFGATHFASLAWKYCVLQRKGDRHRNLPALLSLLAATAYVLYLDETRTLLEVFNCAPPKPAKYTSAVVPLSEAQPAPHASSDSMTYLRSAGMPCDSSSSLYGGTLVPVAIIGLIVYTIGYPLVLAIGWWRNRELVMEDQLLRAKGTGGDRLTNPHAYKFRKAWGRSYLQFRPDTSFWVVMIVLRKLAVAAAQVIVPFNQDPQFQMAVCLLVLLCAYALQVRVAPYMSPSDYDQVLTAHERASLTSPLHARLRATLANIETRGRKRGRHNVMDANGRVNVGAALTELRAWLSNYNTFEATLLFSAVLVCLLGMVYDASIGGSSGALSTISGASTGVAGLLLALIAVTLAYIAMVVGGEAWLLWAESRERKRVLESRKASMRRTAGGDADTSKRRLSASPSLVAAVSPFRGSVRALGAGGVSAEPTEQSLNPLFASGAAGGTSVGDLNAMKDQMEALLAAPGLPSLAVWAHVRDVYKRTATALDEALLTIAEFKKEDARTAVIAPHAPIRPMSSKDALRNSFGPMRPTGPKA